MKFAFDIGGVVKNLIDDNEIEGAVESIHQLAMDNEIVFISKCKKPYQNEITIWLHRHGLSCFPIYFCESYDGKFQIAKVQKVDVMVDDKMQVLQTFPDSGRMSCIWFCSEPKRIIGAYKYQPEFVERVKIATHWTELVSLLADQ